MFKQSHRCLVFLFLFLSRKRLVNESANAYLNAIGHMGPERCTIDISRCVNFACTLPQRKDIVHSDPDGNQENARDMWCQCGGRQRRESKLGSGEVSAILPPLGNMSAASSSVRSAGQARPTVPSDGVGGSKKGPATDKPVCISCLKNSRARM